MEVTVTASSLQMAESAAGTPSGRTESDPDVSFARGNELRLNRHADRGPQPTHEVWLPAGRGRVCPGSSPPGGSRAPKVILGVKLASLWGPVVWSNTRVDAAVRSILLR